jgi:hypothetical protein
MSLSLTFSQCFFSVPSSFFQARYVNAVLAAQLMKAQVPTQSIDSRYLVKSPDFANAVLPERIADLGISHTGRDFKSNERLIDDTILKSRTRRRLGPTQG